MQSVKDLEQIKAFEALSLKKFNGVVLAATGFGKGRVICKCIEELYKKGNKTFLYCCDSQRLRDVDFPAELDKWLPNNVRNNITIELKCYQTTFRWENEKYDVLVGDEFDMAITTQYIKTFLNNKFKHKILFSGTLTNEKKAVVLQIAPIVYTMQVEDAEDAGIINKTNYFVYRFKMTESESRTYSSLTKKISMLMRAGVTFEDSDMQFWLRKRKFFLNALDSSYEACRKVMLHYYHDDKNNRIVAFCELTSQADRVCKYSFHGKNEDDDNLEKFQSGEISAISVVSKIQRGINLKRANIAVFESLSGSSTKFEQKNGRMKRLEIDDTATVVFLLPYYEKDGTWVPTVVEKWIEKATGNLKNIDIKTLKI